MKLSEHIANERKQVLNRDWKYLSEFQRNNIFLRFLAGSVPYIGLDLLNRYIEHWQIMIDRLSYPAHWL